MNKTQKITKKQLIAAEEVICRYVQDPYARQGAINQLYWQVKLLKKLGNLWVSTGEPAVTFYVEGRLDIRLSKAVCEVLGLL
jgi:hypothetical protein